MEKKDWDFIPVIVGGDVGAYSIARSFHEEYNIKSFLLCTAKIMPTAYSKIVIPVYNDGLADSKTLVNALINLANEHTGKKLLLIACGDWYVRIVIENKDELSKLFVVPYIDEKLMNSLVLKDKFYDLCRELDIPYPMTKTVNVGEDEELEFKFNYPVIAKPAHSAMYHYAKFEGKRKVFKFDNRDDLSAMLGRLAKTSYNYKFLIQDFIPGDDTGMRILTCYSDKNGKVKFMSFGHSLLEEHAPGAIGNPVAIINAVDLEIMNKAKKLLEHVGYVGYSNFDIKYDPRDNTYKFFEINVRLGRSNFYVTASGFNTVKFIVDEYIYNKEITPCIANKEHLYCVIPKRLLLKNIKDKEIKDKIKTLIAKKEYTNPYIYKKDRGLPRLIAVFLMFINYYKKYYIYKEM